MTENEKPCPDCAETVKAAAKICRFCGHKFKEKGILAQAVEQAAIATEKAAQEALEKSEREKEESEAAIARGEKPKFKWKSGKGCLIIVAAIILIPLTFNTIARLVDPEGYAERELALEQQRAAEAAKIEAEEAAEEEVEADKKRRGFHCLSSWDGSNRSLVSQVESSLRNPDSFEHVETRITPLDEASGMHGVWMTYRGQNGFGGMNVEQVYARIDHESCSATVLPDGPGS